MAARELTRSERAAIRRLVLGRCANYDRLYKVCLPLDCECPMLKQWWTAPLCRYFQSAALPTEPALEAVLTGNDHSQKHKLCPVCGKAYLPTTSQAYCSGVCRSRARRRAERERKRKARQKQA